MSWGVTIKALNRIWCSNFFTPKICWNMSNSCSLVKMLSLLSGCMRVGRLCSSSPKRGWNFPLTKGSTVSGGFRTHPIPSEYNQTLPSTTLKPFPYSGHQSPATISPSSRCYYGTLPGSHAGSKLHSQPSSERGLTWGTHRGTTAQHSEMLRLPLFASLPSWTLGSGWLSCRDSVLWFSAVASSYHSVVCCWRDTRCTSRRIRRAECAVCVLLLRSYGVQRAQPDPSVVHSPTKAMGKLDVEAVDFEVNWHSAMNDLVMRGRDCDWKKEQSSMTFHSIVDYNFLKWEVDLSGLSFSEKRKGFREIFCFPRKSSEFSSLVFLIFRSVFSARKWLVLEMQKALEEPVLNAIMN